MVVALKFATAKVQQKQSICKKNQTENLKTFYLLFQLFPFSTSKRQQLIECRCCSAQVGVQKQVVGQHLQ